MNEREFQRRLSDYHRTQKMSVELATKLLSECDLECMYDDETAAALDMAIKALEQMNKRMTEEQVIEKLKHLWTLAEQEDDKDGKRNKYEFELGKNIWDMVRQVDETVDEDIIFKAIFMGIPVRCNVVNPDEIRLWKEIR